MDSRVSISLFEMRHVSSSVRVRAVRHSLFIARRDASLAAIPLELAAQHFARRPCVRPGRRFANAQASCDVGERHAFHIAQHRDLPTHARQFQHATPHFLAQLFALGGRARIFIRATDRFGIRRRDDREVSTSPSPSASRVDREPKRRAHEPRLDIVGTAPRSNRPREPGDRLVGRLLGIGAVAQHPPRDRDESTAKRNGRMLPRRGRLARRRPFRAAPRRTGIVRSLPCRALHGRWTSRRPETLSETARKMVRTGVSRRLAKRKHPASCDLRQVTAGES